MNTQFIQKQQQQRPAAYPPQQPQQQPAAGRADNVARFKLDPDAFIDDWMNSMKSTAKRYGASDQEWESDPKWKQRFLRTARDPQFQRKQGWTL